MKKLGTLVVLAVLLAGTLALTACAEEHDPALVGSWEWEDAGVIYITFNADGTGVRNWNETQTFRWSTSGNSLNMNLDQNPGPGHIQNERWTFSISGDRVTFESRQTDEVYTYVRR